MKKLMTATISALLCASSALACQPPRDMPSGVQEQQQYWERARDLWHKQRLAAAPTVMVAHVSLILPDAAKGPPENGISATLTPIKLLLGPAQTDAAGVNAPGFWCEDFRVGVPANGIYLLAMHGKAISMAIPLVEGQEQAGVSAFFARIGVANMWK